MLFPVLAQIRPSSLGASWERRRPLTPSTIGTLWMARTRLRSFRTCSMASSGSLFSVRSAKTRRRSSPCTPRLRRSTSRVGLVDTPVGTVTAHSCACVCVCEWRRYMSVACAPSCSYHGVVVLLQVNGWCHLQHGVSCNCLFYTSRFACWSCIGTESYCNSVFNVVDISWHFLCATWLVAVSYETFCSSLVIRYMRWDLPLGI